MIKKFNNYVNESVTDFMKGPDKSDKNIEINKQLTDAVLNKDAELVKKLISEGADINYMDGHILMNAVSRKDKAAIELAIDNGAKIHTSSRTFDVFCRVCEDGDLDMVKYFVSKGADVTIFDNEPIKDAFPYGGIPVLKFLLDNGADVNAIEQHDIDCAEVANGHTKEALFIKTYKLGKSVKQTASNVIHKFKNYMNGK